MGLSQQLEVNGGVVCDCGHRKFFIGVQRDARGCHFIRLLVCAECGHEMTVPFQSFSVWPPGPTVKAENVKVGI